MIMDPDTAEKVSRLELRVAERAAFLTVASLADKSGLAVMGNGRLAQILGVSRGTARALLRALEGEHGLLQLQGRHETGETLYALSLSEGQTRGRTI